MKSGRSHSWLWDSHISPKNSKWLEESLKDMDTKVSAMLKLIEEDADSFAKRAEMFYKKRPELMRMVEEFYRSYRALAERYDNLTGAIRKNVQSSRSEVSGEPSGEPPFGKRIRFKRTQGDVASLSIHNKNGNDSGNDNVGVDKSGDERAKRSVQKKKSNSSSSSSDSGSGSGSSSDSDGDSDPDCSSENDTHGPQKEKNVILERFEAQKQEQNVMESKLKKLQEQLDNFVAENKHLASQVIKQNKFEERVTILEVENRGLVAKNTILADALHEGSTQIKSYEQKIMQLGNLIRERNEESVKLKMELESQAGCNKLLEEQIVKLKGDVSSLHTEKESYEQQIAKLQTEVNEAMINDSYLRKAKQEAENQLTQTETKLQCLTTECISMKAELLQLQEKQVTLKSELSRSNEALEKFEEENKDLQKKEKGMSNQIKCHSDQIERLQLHVSQLEAEVLALQKLNAAIDIKLQSSETECQKHIEEEQAYSSKVHELEKDLSCLRVNKHNLDQLIVCREREIQDLQELVSKMQKENKVLQDEIMSNLEQITSMKRELQNAHEEKNALNERVQSKSQELLEVHITVKQLNEQFQELQANYQSLERSHQRGMDEKIIIEEALNKKQIDLAHLQEEYDEIKDNNSTKEAHIMDLENKIVILGIDVLKLKDEVDRFQSKDIDNYRLFENLRSENENLKNDNAEIICKVQVGIDEIQKLQKKLQQSHDYHASLENSNKRHIDEKAMLEVFIKNLREELSTLQMEHDELKLEVSSRSLYLVKLEAEKNSIQEQWNIIDREKVELLEVIKEQKCIHEKEIKNREMLLSNLQEKYEMDRMEKERAETHISEIETKIVALEELNGNLRREVSLLQEEKQALQSKVSLKLVYIKKLEDEISMHVSSKERLRMEHDTLKSEISTKNLKIQSLETEGRNVQEHLDQVAKEKETIIQKHEEEIREWELEQSSYESRIHTLENNLSQVEMESRKLNEMLSSYLQKIQVLGDENRSLISDVESKNEQMTMLQKDIHCLHEEQKKSQQLLQNSVEEQLRMELSFKELQDKLEKADEHYTSLYNSHIQSVDENRNLDGVINSVREELLILGIAHDALKAEMSTKDMLFVKLEKEQKKLQKHMDDTVQEKEFLIRKHEEEVRKLNMAHDLSISMIHDLRSSIAHIQLEKHHLDEVILSKSQEIQVLETQKKSLQDDIQSHHEQTAMLQKEIHCLQEEKMKLAEMLQVKSQQLLELEITIKELENKLHKLQEYCSNLDNSHKRSIDDKTILEGVIKNAREELSALQTVHDALKAEMSTKDLHILSMKEECNNLQEYLDKVEQEKESILQKHEEERKKQEATQISYQSRIHELEDAFSQVQMEKRNLDGIVLSNLQQIHNLQEENKSLRDDIHSTNGQIAVLQKEIHCLQEDGKNSQQNLQAKADQLFEMQIKGKELQEKLQKSQEYCRNLDDSYKHTIEEKKALEEVMKKAKDELSSLEVEYDALKIKMSAKQLHLDMMKDELEQVVYEKERVIQMHEEDIRKWELTQSSYMSMTQELQDTISQVKTEKYNLDETISSKLQEIKALQEENKSLRIDLQMSNDQIAVLHKDIQCAEENGKNLWQELQTNTEKLLELEINLKELQENLQKSQEYSNSLEILHKMTIDEKNALETLVKNAHEEFLMLQMKYDVLKTKMAAKDLEIETLEAERGSMNKDLEMMDIYVKQLVQDKERIMHTHKVESKHWELLHLDLQNKCELHVKEKEKLEDQIYKMKAELQNQEQRSDNLKIQIFQLQESNESMNGELSMLKEEHKILQDKEKDLNGTVDLVNIKLSKLEIEALDMENSILSLEEKNKQLLSAKESGIHELSSLGKQIEQLQHELGLLMEEKHVLQSEVSSGFILIKKLEDEINLHVIEEEKMQEEQKKLNSENYDLKAQLHDILQKFEEIVHRLQSSSMDSHEAYERTIEDRTIEASNGLGIDRLNTVVDRVIQKVQLDKDDHNTLLIQMSQKDNFIIDLQNQVSRLETEKLNLEQVGDALRHENKTFQKTLQNRDAHIEEIEEENKRLHLLMPGLQEQIDTYKEAAGIMQTRIDELLAQLLKLQSENNNLLGIIETKTEAIRVVEQENYNLKDNISAHLTQIYVIEGNILHLQEENQKLSCVIENKDIVGDKLQEHIQEAHENISKLQKEQEVLQQQARDLQQQHDELEEINQKLKREVSAGLETIQKLENNVSALHTEKTTLTQELNFQIESSKKLHHETISLQELLEKKDFNIKRHVDLNIKLIDDLQKQMFSLGNDYDISSEVKTGLEPVAQLELVMYRVLDHLREQQNKIREMSEKHQHGVATIKQLEIELVILQENNSKLKLEVEERSMQLTKFEHQVNAMETEKRKLNQLALWCREIGNSLNRSDRNSNDVQCLSKSLEGNSRIKEGKAEEVIDLTEFQDMLSKLVMEKKLLGEKLLIQTTEKRILNENLDFLKSQSVELDGQVQLLRKRSEKQESSLQEKESHIHILNQEKKTLAAKFEILEHQYKSDLENIKQMREDILDLQEYCKTLQKEILQGRILIKEIETNISGLRTEKGLLRDEVTSSIILNEELHKLYDVKLDLEKALNLQSTEIHRQEEKIQILQERMAILQEEKKQSKDRYYEKLDEMKVVEDRLKQLQENINTLEVENTRVIDDILDRVKQHEAELYTLQIEKEDLYIQLNNHLHHATKAEEELHTTRAISELLRKTAEGEKERSKNLETTIAELVSITTTLKEEKSKILDDYKHSKEQQNKLEVKLANLDQEKKNMQEEIFSHTKEMAKLQDQITNVGLENEALTHELSVKTSKICQLEANVNDLQNENMHLEKMLHTRVQQQDDDIQKLLETISHVYEKERALAEDLQYHLHQYKSGSKLMMELEGELLQLQGESKVLESELLGRDSLLEKVEKDLLQYQEGKANCKLPENEHDADADALRAKLQKLQNEDMRLKAKLLVVTKQVENLERRILAMQEENRKLVAEVEASAQQGRHLMLALTFMKAEVKRVVHRTTNLKIEIADHNLALTAKNDNLCRLQDQIQYLQLKTGVEIEELQQRSEDRSLELASEDLSSELSSLHEKVVIPQEDNVAEKNREPIVIIQEDNKKQKQYLGIVAEEDREETIRQLCFSLKYLKAKNKKLEKSLRSFKVRLRIRYRNSPSTWRSCLAPWYKPSQRKIS